MYAVYSSILEGYLAMEIPTKEEAEQYIVNYHCREEVPYMRVVFISREK